jgi:hypothetical protein
MLSSRMTPVAKAVKITPSSISVVVGPVVAVVLVEAAASAAAMASRRVWIS